MFIVMRKRHYYAGTLGVNDDWVDLGFDPMTEDRARAKVVELEARLEQQSYHLSHGEYATPSYEIREVEGC
jgi:hypothetical protein